jgi:hypothetical protein
MGGSLISDCLIELELVSYARNASKRIKREYTLYEG